MCHTVGMTVTTQQTTAEAAAFRASKLRELGKQRRRLENDLADLRPRLADLIRAATRDGMRQVDIVQATGYTREMIRRIVGAA